MATKWSDIYNGELYQKAPLEEKIAVQKDYFDKIIAPQVKEQGDDIDEVWNDFKSKYPVAKDEPSYKGIIGRKITNAAQGSKLENTLGNFYDKVREVIPDSIKSLAGSIGPKPYDPNEPVEQAPSDVFTYSPGDTQNKRLIKSFLNSGIASNPLLSIYTTALGGSEELPNIQEKPGERPIVAGAQALSPLEDPISSNILFGGALRGITTPALTKGIQGLKSGLVDAISGITGGASDAGAIIGEKIYQKIAPKIAQRSLMKGIKNAPEINSLLDVPSEMVEKLKPDEIRHLGTKVTSNKVEEIAPYINRLAERLGQEDAANVIKNNMDIIDAVGENKLLHELSEAVYRKETIGQYGSVTEIVNKAKPITREMADGTKFVEFNKPPVYAAELNMLKKLPIMEENKFFQLPSREKVFQQGLYTPSNRVFDDLGEDFKNLTYKRLARAEHLKNLEYDKTKIEMKNLFKGISNKSSERIGTYAVAQQKDGMSILNTMKKTVPELNEQEISIYNTIRSKYEDLYKRIQEARIKSGLEPFEKVENYFTFFKDIGDMERAGVNPILAKKDVIDKFIRPNATSFAFAKERIRNARAVDLDAHRVFNKYNHSALNHIYMSPEIAKTQALNRTLQDGDKVFRLIDVNPYASEFLDQWTSDIAGKKVWTQLGGRKLKGLDNFMEKANRNLTYSVLSYNFDSAAKQFLAFRNTLPEIGTANLMKGVEMNLSPVWRKYALKNSAHLNSRFFETGIEDVLNDVKGIQRKLGNAGITPLKLLDAETARSTWLGAFNKSMKATKDTKKAIDYADDVVIRTQGSASKLDRAPISRTPTGKAASLFQTFAISDWNYLKKDVFGIGHGKKFHPGKLTKYVIATAIANKIYNDGLGMDAFPNPIKALETSADEGNSNAKIAFDVAMEMSGVHPVLGSAKYGFSVGGAAIKTIGNSFEKLSKGKNLDVLGALMETAKLVGIPGYGQALKIGKGLSKGSTLPEAIHGKYKKKEKDEFDIPEIKGDFDL